MEVANEIRYAYRQQVNEKRDVNPMITTLSNDNAYPQLVGGLWCNNTLDIFCMYLCRGIWYTRAFEIVGETSVKDGYTLQGYDEVERSCK